MRSKTDRELTQDEKIQQLVNQDYEAEKPAFMFDPAEPDDRDHLEVLGESHGYACCMHRLREFAVDANFQALRPGMDPLRAAWNAGYFHGIQTALQVREGLLAEATGGEFKIVTDPTIDHMPPRAGSKAVAASKPTLRVRRKKNTRRKSA